MIDKYSDQHVWNIAFVPTFKNILWEIPDDHVYIKCWCLSLFQISLYVYFGIYYILVSFIISDIFVCVFCHSNSVTPKGYHLGICSTIVETDNPQEELQTAIALLGRPLEV